MVMTTAEGTMHASEQQAGEEALTLCMGRIDITGFARLEGGAMAVKCCRCREWELRSWGLLAGQRQLSCRAGRGRPLSLQSSTAGALVTAQHQSGAAERSCCPANSGRCGVGKGECACTLG